jgi:hypothetical protein
MIDQGYLRNGEIEMQRDDAISAPRCGRAGSRFFKFFGAL